MKSEKKNADEKSSRLIIASNKIMCAISIWCEFWMVNTKHQQIRGLFFSWNIIIRLNSCNEQMTCVGKNQWVINGDNVYLNWLNDGNKSIFWMPVQNTQFRWFNLQFRQ